MRSLIPFDEFDRFFSNFPQMSISGFVPAMDVYQTKDYVIVETSLPGMKPEDVNVVIENDILTIQGSMEKKTEVDEKDYYRKEIRSGGFHRSVVLSVSVQGDRAEAEYASGVLRVKIPKAEHAKPKSITVNVKEK
ncbi:MAG: Hsp20/alpha crystallin family protein [Patescibacteria group bacterium]